MRRPTATLAALLLAAAARPVWADASSSASPAPDAAAVVGACPAARPGEADLAVVLWEQRTRSPEDVARAQAEDALSPETFADVVGGPVLAGRPRTAALLDEALARASATYRAVKKRCARPRPAAGDARVRPALAEQGFSFPSGHATRGEVLARLLAELQPARREALLARGRRVGDDRVVLGVHFPSDVEAGRRLADALVDGWLADPAYRAGVEAIRAAEWAGPEPAAATRSR